jgi:hypothetical protein
MLFPERRLASRRIGSWACSWCATLFVLAYALFELLSFRFIVYEETIAYFVVFQLLALAAYAHFLESKRAGWAAAVGVAASAAILVRATGLPYLCMWGALLLLQTWRWSTAAAFAGAAAPGTVFCFASNWIRSGTPMSFGYGNSNPAFPVHFQMLRFGSTCGATPQRFHEVCRELFDALFVEVPGHSAILGDCGFTFESRLPTQVAGPYLPPALLLLFGVSLLWCLARRERRLAFYVPHAMIVALFFAYARASTGFIWRYAYDFWPAFVLLGLQEMRRVRLEKREGVLGLAAACAFFAAGRFYDDVKPALASLQVTDQAGMLAVEDEYQREQATIQPALPSRIVCGEQLPTWPRADGIGWYPGCGVGVVSNVYLGVPPSSRTRYRLRAEVDHAAMPSVSVYVNGRVYAAQLRGQSYEVDVDIDPRRLRSPVVMVAVEWSRTGSPPPIRFLSIELTS